MRGGGCDHVGWEMPRSRSCLEHFAIVGWMLGALEGVGGGEERS